MGKQAPPYLSVRKPERLGNWRRLTQLSIREEASARGGPGNPTVFNILTDVEPLGLNVLKTAENFRAQGTGEKGSG